MAVNTDQDTDNVDFFFRVEDFNEVEDFGNINIESLFFLGGSQYIVACEASEGLNTGPVVFHIYCLGPARCIGINLIPDEMFLTMSFASLGLPVHVIYIVDNC